MADEKQIFRLTDKGSGRTIQWSSVYDHSVSDKLQTAYPVKRIGKLRLFLNWLKAL